MAAILIMENLAEMQENNNNILDVVGCIYEAAHRPDYWESALAIICHLINARSASLLIQSHEKKRTFLMYGHAIPRMVQFAYNHGLASLNPGWIIMAGQPPGAPLFFTKSDNQNAPTIYQKIVMNPSRMYYLLGMNIFNDSSWHVGIGLHRDKPRGNFAEPELKMVSELLPHLRRSILMQREFAQLRLHKRALTEGLSRLALGVMLLDGAGYPVYANPVAKLILEEHPAIELTSAGVTASQQEKNQVLRETIIRIASDRNVNSPPVNISLKHEAKKLPLTIILAPYRDAEPGVETLHHDAKMIMYLSDAEAAAPLTIDSLVQYYGLSETEAEVAIGIVNGLTIEQIAEAHYVSINTIKTQLKSVFRKTGCNRQADLVRKFLNNQIIRTD